MIKKICIACILIGIITYALEMQSMQKKIDTIVDAYQQGKKIKGSELPSPYHDLLSQSLMTKALATHYQRTPIIEILHVRKNLKDKTYSRVIRMWVDGQMKRNNAKLAQKKHEGKVVELALITINFKALTKKLMHDVQHTSIPFGRLLINSHIQIMDKNRTYFAIQCNKDLQSLAQCQLNTTLYGRTHSIYRADNQQWLAYTIEILLPPGG